MSPAWHVRLARQAERDLHDISRWTAENFSQQQAVFYAETIMQAIESLESGPEIPGARARDEIAPGICTLHVAQRGRKGRHFVVFREGGDRIIDVLRLLHDSMDLARHIPATSDHPQ